MKIELTIIISILSSAGTGGLLQLLLKTYWTEKIRTQIKYEYDLKFETARKELERKATEHQVQYSKLHLDRSENLKLIFNKLIDGEKALERLTTLGQGPTWTTDELREKQAWDKLDELKDLIQINRIFFDNELCKMLDKITVDYRDVIVKMGVAKTVAGHESRTGQRTEPSSLQQWMDLRDRVNGEIVSARQSIEDEFRKILGV